MVGVNVPGGFVWEPEKIDMQLRAYADLCAKDDTCRRHTGDLAETMRRVNDKGIVSMKGQASPSFSY